jgi:hypothetical protein
MGLYVLAQPEVHQVNVRLQRSPHCYDSWPYTQSPLPGSAARRNLADSWKGSNITARGFRGSSSTGWYARQRMRTRHGNLVNSSALEGSRRSVSTAISVSRLTIIGTIFIPMSFITSVWGTNFREFGSGSRPVWMLFASMVPLILLSYLIYNWDTLKKLGHKMRSTRRRKADLEI